MAKLSSNGREIGRVELLGRTLVFMESGKVLGNSGDGWRVKYKVKAGYSPKDAFDAAAKRVRDLEERVPSYRKLRDALFAAVRSRKDRTRVYLALKNADPFWIERDPKLMGVYHRLSPLYAAMKVEVAAKGEL